MTTPLSWAENYVLRYGDSRERIDFNWSTHQIVIGNTKEVSGSTVSYNEIVLGTVTDGTGLEIVHANGSQANITAGATDASIYIAANRTAFNVSVNGTNGVGNLVFSLPLGDNMFMPVEGNFRQTGSWLSFCAANQKDDEENAVYFEVANYGIHMPLLWKTSATDSTKIKNEDYPICYYDAKFLSLTDNSSIDDHEGRNYNLTQTIPSTYAVRTAINSMVAPFSFVAKTDENNNDYFGVKFTDPANPNTTKTLWFNFATVDDENVGIGEWENATTRKSTTP